MNLFRKIKNTKAQSFIEFAFVAPIMMMVFMLIIDFGRFQIARWDIMNATRDTVRWMSLQKPDNNSSSSKLEARGRCMAKKFFEVANTNGIFDDSPPEIKVTDGSDRGKPIGATICGTVTPISLKYLPEKIKFLAYSDQQGRENSVCYTYVMYRNLAPNKNVQVKKDYSMSNMGC